MSELPHGWVTMPLGDVCDVLDSRRTPVNAEERRRRHGDVPYYGATGQVGWIDGYIFDEDLVLLGEDGAPFLDPSKAKAYMVRGRAWVNNHAHVLRARESILPAFLLYQLNTVDYHPFVTGTTRLKLSQAPMRKIPVRLAPLAEQRRVVAALEEHLSDLDAAVAGLERAQLNVDRYREALRDDAASGRLLGGADRSSYGPEERIPEGWHWATVGECAARERNAITDGPFGSKLKTEHYVEEGPRVIRLQNIGRGRFIDAKAHISTEHFATLQKHRVYPGDVVIAALGETLPRACVIPERVGPAIVKADCIRFRPDPSVLLSAFANVALNAESTRRRVTAAIHGVGRPRLNLGEIREIGFLLPPLEVQQRVVESLERCFAIADRTAAEIDVQLARATRLRQAILKRAFEGKLVPQVPSDEPASELLARIHHTARPNAHSPSARRPTRTARR